MRFIFAVCACVAHESDDSLQNPDSVVMKNIAEFGGGCFTFIPDCGFVGTCIGNMLSYCTTQVVRDLVLNISDTSQVSIALKMLRCAAIAEMVLIILQ